MRGEIATRHLLVLSLLVPVAGVGTACSSSSGSAEVVQSTLITVTPTSFKGTVACGPNEGAWKVYVATLADVTDPKAPVRLASSMPVACGMPVSFAFVIPGHKYAASIQGYDREDITPYGGASSGSQLMVDRTSNADVVARWATTCGPWPQSNDTAPVVQADAGSSDASAIDDSGLGSDGADASAISATGASTDGGVLPHDPTIAFTTTNVHVQNCLPLEELRPSSPVPPVTFRIPEIPNAPACGTGAGSASRFKVILTSPGPEASLDLACPADAPSPFRKVPLNTELQFRVEAFSGDATMPAWATDCWAVAKSGISVPAMCTGFRRKGGIRVSIADLLSSAGSTCETGQTIRYQVSIARFASAMTSQLCRADALFSPLDPGAYQLIAVGYGANDRAIWQGYCEAAVLAGSTTAARCQGVRLPATTE